ncbi:hypothetical protein DKX38_013820 [Salix brachista]|uniref:Vacuolar protein 8 n=1 Tax=Salix brachista TaxID=2182728 RepID=A0A5N5LFP5_9ROSI|nr:hypothetical protein DKX38_013820 [Salix brachista]
MIKVLNVAEKPSVAKSVAKILSRNQLRVREGRSRYNKIFEFNYSINGQQCHMLVTGHLMEVDFEDRFRKWHSCDPADLYTAPVRKHVPEELGSVSEEVSELRKLLQNETQLRKAAEDELNKLKSQFEQFMQPGAGGDTEIIRLHKILEDEAYKKKSLEEEVAILQSQLLQLTFEAGQSNKSLERSGSANGFNGVDSHMSQVGHLQYKETLKGQKAPTAPLYEHVGLQKILSLLESEDANVRIHAVKVVANLAAEEANQEKIVESGGLASLLMLLRSFEDETIRRVAAGAIANLAMNEANQELIMVQGGISLLSITVADAEDPQTLRMVAGAIANLCGNGILLLRSEGGIRALLGMERCGHPDVLSQVARGIANFAKCESRSSTQGKVYIFISDFGKYFLDHCEEFAAFGDTWSADYSMNEEYGT